MEETTYELKCYAGDYPRILVTTDFIARNRLEIRSLEEIRAKLDKERNEFLSFMPDVFIDLLPWEMVESMFKDESRDEAKAEFRQITDIKEIAQDFLDYMVFAWGKAMDERGISASRSIQKLSAWMFALSRDDVVDVLEDNDLYNPYGMRALLKACDMLGIDAPQDVREWPEKYGSEELFTIVEDFPGASQVKEGA